MTARPALAAAPERVERRASAETRALLLMAARRRFAASHYADVTLRDIAADAQVSPALVVKYFGTKEQLLHEAADFGEELAALLAVPDDELAEHLVAHLLDVHEASPSHPLMFLLFMGKRPGAPHTVRQALHEQFLAPLADRLGGDADAALRAELVCSQLVGLSALRRVLGTAALRDATTEELVDLCAPLLRSLLRTPQEAASEAE